MTATYIERGEFALVSFAKPKPCPASSSTVWNQTSSLSPSLWADSTSWISCKSLKRNTYIGDVRGKGMMIGVEFVKDKETKEPFPPEMKLGEKLYQKGIENGLILMECMGIDHGKQGDALLFGPCFEFTEGNVDEAIRLLEKTIGEVI